MGAAAVPIAIAGASLAATNAGNKAAIKNNEVQQASAVGNAQQAWQGAQQNVGAWEGAHPAPFANATVERPAAGAYGPGGTVAPTSYDQSLAPLVAMILGAQHPPAATGASMPAHPPAPAPPSQPLPDGGHTRSLLSNPLVAHILAAGRGPMAPALA